MHALERAYMHACDSMYAHEPALSNPEEAECSVLF